MAQLSEEPRSLAVGHEGGQQQLHEQKLGGHRHRKATAYQAAQLLLRSQTSEPLLACAFSALCHYRFAWKEGRTTYKIFLAAEDELDGVFHSDTPYCERNAAGRWIDASTGERCIFRYFEVGDRHDLADYFYSSLLQLPKKIKALCPECSIAIADADASPRGFFNV